MNPASNNSLGSSRLTSLIELVSSLPGIVSSWELKKDELVVLCFGKEEKRVHKHSGT